MRQGQIVRTNNTLGLAAEAIACRALAADGWSILARRARTKAGEIDAVAEKDGLVAFVEVKSRRTLALAADALGSRQQQRLLGAAEILLAETPAGGGPASGSTCCSWTMPSGCAGSRMHFGSTDGFLRNLFTAGAGMFLPPGHILLQSRRVMAAAGQAS